MRDVAGNAKEPQTTIHVRKAIKGDRGSLDWIVTRFSPLVRIQVAYRLQGIDSLPLGADDVVAEAWLVTLPRLSELSPREDRYTPVLLRYLSTTARNIVNDKLRQFARRRQLAPGEQSGDRATQEELLDSVPSRLRGAVAAAAHGEVAKAVSHCLSELDETSRELIIMRAIEGITNQEIAALKGESPNTIAQRYRRALQRLRSCLPDSVFDELTES